MRRVAILIGLLGLFVGQANEMLHEHAVDHVAQDCVACQADSSPADAHRASLTPESAPYTVDTVQPMLTRPTPGISLLTAPKTSPPG